MVFSTEEEKELRLRMGYNKELLEDLKKLKWWHFSKIAQTQRLVNKGIERVGKLLDNLQ